MVERPAQPDLETAGIVQPLSRRPARSNSANRRCWVGVWPGRVGTVVGVTEPRRAWAFGLAPYAVDGAVLDVWCPEPTLGSPPPDYHVPSTLASLEGSDDVRCVTKAVVHIVVDDLDVPPADAADVWLRLQLLSHRLVPPRGQNLDGVFRLLTNVVWTDLGPCAVDGFAETRMRALDAGRHVVVHGIDKFPRMTDYVVPSGVRIADADRVRLGAHLAPGTTVMHEGFVNYNAGTLGASMVEGRISAGVSVGDGSDVGGGASIMGTLSGGGKQIVSLGERCLLGANAGIGISLGDDCIVEAGTYVTAGSKVALPDGQVVKAATLSGQSGWQYWRNSV